MPAWKKKSQTGVDSATETDQSEEYVYIDEAVSDDELQLGDSAQTNPERDQRQLDHNGSNRSSFFDGIAAGLGIGCIASFAIIWATLYLSPLLPQSATYEGLLSVFVYLLIFLVGTGLVALTAGLVREYYPKNQR